jgi:hypothetical protein
MVRSGLYFPSSSASQPLVWGQQLSSSYLGRYKRLCTLCRLPFIITAMRPALKEKRLHANFNPRIRRKNEEAHGDWHKLGATTRSRRCKKLHKTWKPGACTKSKEVPDKHTKSHIVSRMPRRSGPALLERQNQGRWTYSECDRLSPPKRIYLCSTLVLRRTVFGGALHGAMLGL